MKSRGIVVALAVAGILLAGSVAQAADIPISNSSFESPDVADGANNKQAAPNPNLGGWGSSRSANANSHIGVWDPAGAGQTNITGEQHVRVFIEQTDGGWVKLTSPTLSGQSVNGATYSLSVDIAGSGGTFNSGGAGSELQLWVGGSKVATQNIPATMADGTFNPISLNYVAGADGLDMFAQVFFRHTAAGGNGSAPIRVDVDNVLLSDDVVIPEPATMMLLGIGGLGALIRRRRK